MGLREYKRKRDFSRTSEPEPTPSPLPGQQFAVQKHDARTLHYDLRLEVDGVMRSWAVPKGPSLDPSEKRLAVQVEDHPIEYASFEGVIPEGEYGGGTVMLWDSGTWRRLEIAHKFRKSDIIKFELDGEKLRGAWTLVRLKSDDGPNNWLLIKEKDDFAHAENDYCVLAEEPFSVASGRGLQEIADNRKPVDDGGRRRGLYFKRRFTIGSIPGAKPARRASPVRLLRPKSAKVVPVGDDWLHEVLHRGRRVECRLTPHSVTINDGVADLAKDLPHVARSLAKLPVDATVLDGVLTVLDRAGRDDPAATEDALCSPNPGAVVLFLFDIRLLNDFDLRGVPLARRKELLNQLLDRAESPLHYCDHIVGSGDQVVAGAQALGAWGIVSKRSDSSYPSRATTGWTWVTFDVSGSRENNEEPQKAAHSSRARETRIGGIRITNPHRTVYPEAQVTKRMLVEYFEATAHRILPHIANRPLSLYRCPAGVEGDGFFQKHLGEMPSEHLKGVDVTKEVGDVSYIVVTDLAGLLTAAQWNVLELHPWGCQSDNVDKPDRIIFDLDPGPKAPWGLTIEGAKGLRYLLSEMGLESFVKTSGGKGLHVVVPLVRRHTWDEVKSFAGAVARKISKAAPKHFTSMSSVAERVNKVYIDYLRNARGATCVAPYSPRARRGGNRLRSDRLGRDSGRTSIQSRRGEGASGTDGSVERFHESTRAIDEKRFSTN